MNRLAYGAHIEPLTSYKWQMSGPYCTVIIERDESTPEAMWSVHPERSTEPLWKGARCEGALSDAYSRCMGFTR